MFQSSEPKEHSSLRRLASKVFSRRSILQYEPQIHETLELLSSILSTKASTNTAFDLSKMSRCLSLDFICKFTYGQTLEALKVPDFNESILEAFDSFAVSNFVVRTLQLGECRRLMCLVYDVTLLTRRIDCVLVHASIQDFPGHSQHERGKSRLFATVW